MAILSKKLDLDATAWQLVTTATGFVGQKKETVIIKICNADALPSGNVEEAQTINSGVNLSFPAPASGNLYATVAEGTATLTYYEI